ncbi:MAG: ABC transporter ATP-binding protein/permease [Alphaproteobacteria bacterium]|nr:ABC transporter ATP-binding protein/permease [Alphaproteobacteria bacterium]
MLQTLTDGSSHRLWRDHIRHQKRWLIFAVGCMVLFSAITASQAFLVKPALDEVFFNRDRTMLWLIPTAVIVLSLVKMASGYGQSVLMGRVGQRIIADLQKRIFAHLMQADLGYFLERGPGPLISGLTYDTQQLRVAVSIAFTGVARDMFTIVGLTGVMFYHDWRLACFAFIGIPLASMVIVRIGRRMRKVAGQSQAQMARLTARLEQTFQGVRQVKADNRELDEAAFANGLIERLFKLNYRAVRTQAISSPATELIGGVAIASIIAYGGFQVIEGHMTPGTFFSFITAMLLVYRPLKALAKLNTQIQEGLAAADRIYTVLDHQPVVRDAPGAKPLRTEGGAIRLERVTFGYLPSRPTIESLNLDIPAGKTVALVGASGAGKSTILNLILRFYDVDEGAVRIDGQDIREITLKSLRGAIALVSQDVDLFDDSVRANIGYGRADASEADIIEAAKSAAAHDFITALPDGYDAVIGPSGHTLSGGQRQRLGIARAMVKDAPILLLDEATSALDSEAEQKIQQALKRLMVGRTTVVIAHRLSTIVGADLIAVMDKGRVVERGNHQELLQAGGVYARLYERQFADQQIADLVPEASPTVFSSEL